MNLVIEIEREADGRWIAEMPGLAGVIVYGETRAVAMRKVRDLAIAVIADRRTHGEGDSRPSTASPDLDFGGGES
ncbi:hypothetical protein [Longimicrobium sp.]|uniref:type II toxin-antitoxin system HicB family antitoxin n=1 Tax=Longimicrobium sp. TaxID=2029185 RepID=UPI002E346BED|nr:hypothetical protein [Longimicrobium sp.]HEX6039735.1 hypothetical protein [Longimicrobium sp.]